MSDDVAVLWKAIEDLRESREAHAVKHAELDGRINAQQVVLSEVRDTVTQSRIERNAQFSAIAEQLKKISDEVTEERGAKKLRAQLISWGIALASAVGLGAWIHGGGK